tara:strand:- start:424 stop:597 length:174 start_codon:yes stop_codon:yes gene_type:complete
MNKIKRKYFDECPSYKGEDHYIAWLENRVLLMTKLAAKAHEDLIVAHELSILIKETK